MIFYFYKPKSNKGGQSLGAMVEAFAGTEAGQKLLEKVVSLKNKASK